MKRLVGSCCRESATAGIRVPANADSEWFGLRSWIGLWEGIDPVDGGDSLRSITCLRIGAARSLRPTA
jgi:hypothetical protein